MSFNSQYALYLERLNDIEPLRLHKAQGIHPIQMLLDYGYDVSRPNIIIDPDGNKHDIPDLYDLIVAYKKRNSGL